jgi:hypothetical protein
MLMNAVSSVDLSVILLVEFISKLISRRETAHATLVPVFVIENGNGRS